MCDKCILKVTNGNGTAGAHAVVYVLWGRGHLAQGIHRDMLPVCGVNRLFHTAVHSLVKKFPQGHSKL
jgi:hypothetical protein